MSSGLLGAVVLTLCVIFFSYASADDKECESYRDIANTFHSSKRCVYGFCCGTCTNRYCCRDSTWRLTEHSQKDCLSSFDMDEDNPLALIFGIMSIVACVLIIMCCCICPCCCLYKMCRKPRPVIATTTHTTVVTSAPQHYPQQPTAVRAPPQPYHAAVHAPPQPYPAGQYPAGQYQPSYQSVPVQPPYAAQPPTTAYQSQPFVPGPPPTYQEAIGPTYPAQPMPYSQAAFSPGQPPYPLQPSAQQQATAPVAGADFLAQPAYNPDYVSPPPKTG